MMKHLGDITKIKGDEAPTVDVVIGGSPCQDLSTAGKREGLAGERSGLYMEQIRIIKEMRQNDIRRGRTSFLVRPRYMVWENVPGAFSSNKGEDFKAVLEAAVRIKEPQAPDLPMPKKGWTTSGCIYDEMGGWSIAWRVFNAQFWGVPQRRRRIALVADFGGMSAPEILFERKGLSRDSQPSKQKRAETSEDFRGCSEESNSQFKISQHPFVKSKRAQNPQDFETWKQGNCANTLNGFDNGDVRANEVVVAFTQDTYSKYTENDVGKTIVSHGGCYGGGSETLIVENVSYGFDPTSSRDVGKYFNEELANTVINGTCAGHKNGVCCVEAKRGLSMQDVTGTIASSISKQTGNTQDTSIVCETVCAVDFRNGTENALQANALQAIAERSLNGNNVVRCGYIVRRLTPMECERLQGFPDGWTDIGEWTDSKGKKHKPADSPRYKALGNSIALPSWKWVLKRISAQYERDATMASLFDGIGGFPLLWEQINGKGACLWASEIEEFHIAVTKFHFGD